MPHPLKFGVIPAYGLAPLETGSYATEFAELVENLGFESIWPVEHVVMPDHYESTYPYDRSGRMPIEDAAIPDPLIWLTWIAAVAPRLKLGTSILILPQRNPVVLAKAVASLDRLSGGRVILGIGIGWLREEADAVGSIFSERGRRTDEYIDAMRALWATPVASFHGETVRFENMKCNPRPTQPSGVPIHVGGHSPAAARRAGRVGNGFIPMGESPAEIAELIELMRKTAIEHGRDPDEIEISCVGPASIEVANVYAELGVNRMIIPCLEKDLTATRNNLESFAKSMIGPVDLSD